MRVLLLCLSLAAALAGCASRYDSASESSGPAATGYPLASATAVLLAAQPGQALNVPDFGIKNLPKVPYQKVVLPGPQYIISDDPEYIRVPEGVALRERVNPGAVRLYVYNVNGVKEPAEMPRRISAVIENNGPQPMTIRMLRRAFPEPSGNYFHIGKTGLKQFFESRPEPHGRVVQPGQAIPIDPEMEATIVQYNDLVHGFYEFVIDQPAEITVVQSDPQTPGPVAAQRIDEIIASPRANAGRGLFGTSNFLVVPQSAEPDSKEVSGSSEVVDQSGFVLDPANGPVQLVVADGADDPWILGIDGSTDEVARLAGNYGVMYDIRLPMESSDPSLGYALVTYNFRAGGQWCGGMAATVEVGPGLFPAGTVSVPSNQLNTKGFPEVVVLQIFPPDATEARVTYSPPGASCLPTPLVFLPVAF